MRKQVLIAGGVVLLLLIFIFLATRLFRKTPQTVCSKFISNVQKNDAEGSYALFTNSAKSSETQSSWSSLVKGFSDAYGSGKVKYVNQQSNTPGNSSVPTYILSYAITKPNKSVYQVTCSVINNQVDGYSSQLQVTNQ